VQSFERIIGIGFVAVKEVFRVKQRFAILASEMCEKEAAILAVFSALVMPSASET